MHHEHDVVAGLNLEHVEGEGESQANIEDMSENLNRRRQSMGFKSSSDQVRSSHSLFTHCQ